MFFGEAKQRPMVSIVVPTYNRAHLVGRAILSILRQTYTDYEIIVVDDGSNDNTRELVENFDDDRIKYVRHSENRGHCAALNTGIRLARSDFIAFQDSDDEWLPEKLHKQVSRLESAKVGIGAVYTAMWRITNNVKYLVPQKTIGKTEGDLGDIILEQCFIGNPTVLIHKRCFERVGLFDEKLSHGGDWEMWIRVARCFKFSLINEPLVISYQQPDSMTSAKFNREHIRALEMIFEKHRDKFLINPSAMGCMCYHIGHLRCKTGDVKKGRKWLLKSFKCSPINIKRMALIVISLFGCDVYVGTVRLKQKLFGDRQLEW